MTAETLAVPRLEPFRHATCREFLPAALLEETLLWMQKDAPWKLRIASFYEQWELHLSPEILPSQLQELLAPEIITEIERRLIRPIEAGRVRFVEATAHKLVAGQTIRIHNDYLDEGETHRVLFQLNRGWRDEQGGLLMLFGSASPEDVRRIVRPTHGSAFAFEISPTSFHAVSRIAGGDRFTMVYSFSCRDAAV